MTDPRTTIAADRNAPNLAVDIQPDYTRGTFTWDVSDWDGPDLLAWGDGSEGWQNIICDVTDIATRRGLTRAGGVLTVAEEGTCRIVLSDRERRFDPTVNGDTIHPGTKIRVRVWGNTETFDDLLDGGTPASTFTTSIDGGSVTVPLDGVDGGPVTGLGYWSEVLFTGRIGSGDNGIQVAYSKTGAPVVTILAVDRVTPLSAWKATGRSEPGVGGGDDLLERTLRVLDESGLGGTMRSERVSTTITTPVQPVPALTQAAQLILDRMLSGQPITEDWSWSGAPAVVRANNDALLDLYPVTDRVRAAAAILDRMRSGQPLFEDWSWSGNPDFVRRNNDALVAGWGGNGDPQVYLAGVISAAARAWLASYIGANTPPTVPVTFTTTVDKLVGAEYVSTDVDTTYAATLAPSVLARAWDHIDECTEAELGRLWVDRLDRIVVRSRGSELSGPVRGTLSDVHDQIVGGAVHCCYDDADVVYGTELLTNRAIAGRRVPKVDDGPDVPVVIAQVDDGESQARYGSVALERRDLELETDDQLIPWAQAVVLDSTEPELRVNSVRVAPHNAPEAWPAVAATDIGDRWSFRLTPQIGPTIARTLGVLGISHDITPESWECSWVTETAPTPGDNNPSGWFTWDVSDWDGDDILAPIGGAVKVA